MIGQKTRIHLCLLREGTEFIIPSLKEHMRNLKVISHSDTAVRVSGEQFNEEKEEWVKFKDYMSCNTQVNLMPDSE